MEIALMANVKPMDTDDLMINEKFVKNGAKNRKQNKIDRFCNIGFSYNTNKEEEGVVIMNNSWISFYIFEPCRAKKFSFSSMIRLTTFDTYEDKGDVIILHEFENKNYKIRFPTAKSKAKFISCFELRRKNAITRKRGNKLAVQETDTKSKNGADAEKILQSNNKIREDADSKLDEKSTLDKPFSSDAEMIDLNECTTKDEKETKLSFWDFQPSSETVKQKLIKQNVAIEVAIKLSEFTAKQPKQKSYESLEFISSIAKSNLLEVDLSSEKDETESQSGQMFPLLNDLIDSKNLHPHLENMKDHLIAKNVPIDVAVKLCDSVEKNIKGKILETAENVSSALKSALLECIDEILKSNFKNIDILEKCLKVQLLACRLFIVHTFCFNNVFMNGEHFLEARRKFRPYILTLCGANSVGKSTSLAKICHWLVTNNIRVLIASCNTVKEGASEELEMHVKNLNDLHPPAVYGGPLKVQFYKQSSKDAKKIAMKAIKWAISNTIDVVLIDTASLTLENQPLMKEFTIFIKVTAPDLFLFVGDAGTGNEAITQFRQFNQALADSNGKNPRLFDGTVLTKFETIDDKVGSALSLTYSTGKPIVFVGTGQTYSDLKVLNAESITNFLIR